MRACHHLCVDVHKLVVGGSCLVLQMLKTNFKTSPQLLNMENYSCCYKGRITLNNNTFDLFLWSPCVKTGLCQYGYTSQCNIWAADR